MTRAALAYRANISESHISNIENGARRVTSETVLCYATALGVPMLAEIWEADPMQRRAVIAALSRTGALGIAGPAVLGEVLRLSILDRYSGPADWPERVESIGAQFITAPAGRTHHTLGVHLLSLAGEKGDTGDTRNAAAKLMLLRATTTANLGDVHGAKDWYQAACKVARDSGDRRLITWVYGRYATRRGYEDATPQEMLTVTAGIDCAESHLARAHAFARIGRPREARQALDDARRAYPDTDQSEGTAFGFQPWRFRLAEAYVPALLGDVTATHKALADLAIPGRLARFRAQRDLTLAVALARAGDRESAHTQRDLAMRHHPADQTSMILTSMIAEIAR